MNNYDYCFFFLYWYESVILYLGCRQGDEATDVSDSSDTDDVENIGETLFSFVQQLDPAHSADITGESLASLVSGCLAWQ